MANKEDDLKLDPQTVKADGSNKKLIIIFAGAAVGLVALTVVVMMLILGGDKPEQSDAEQPTTSYPLQYYSFKPNFVIGFPMGGRQRYLEVSIDVAQRNPVVADTLKLHDPMIRSEIIRVIGEQTFDSLRTHEGRVVLQERLTEHLADVVKRESGAVGLEAVLFTHFLMQ